MALELETILSEPIRVGAKGVPIVLYGQPLRSVAEAGLTLFGDEMSFPVAVIDRPALNHNLSAMQDYLTKAGVMIAPHGKTTMCPQLFDLQLQAGAWGITLANWPQARVALEYGVKRVIIANELVAPAEIRDLARVQAQNPEIEIHILVDSLAQVERLNSALTGAGAAVSVLIELGFDGGRCGMRDDREALALAEAVASSSRLRLAGIEGYEGLLVSDHAEADSSAVTAFVDRLLALFEECARRGLFDPKDLPVISAGGSAYFDLVARGFTSLQATARPILRSGCYITHDVGFYERLLNNAKARSVLGAPPQLKPALSVWAQVLSRPERGLAIVGLGRRDVSDDSAMPTPIGWYKAAARKLASVSDWSFAKMNDQHGYLRLPMTADVSVGDVIQFGISHPCTTFDRWSHLLEVDAGHRVTGAYRSFF